MTIAVVILNWNGASFLKKFLPSVISYSKEANIYIIDNKSDDNSLELVTKYFSQVNWISNPSNLWYAKGYNEGLKHVKEDLFILLNSDIEVSKDWLLPIIKHFKENPNTAVIQPKILNYHNKSYFEYAGACGGFIDFFGYPFCRGRLFNSLEVDNNQYNNSINISWASGACIAIRKKQFEEAEKFDPLYLAYQEEIDLCWRITNLGYDIKVIPESIVYHVGEGSIGTLNPKKIFLNYRNSLFSILKNHPYPFITIFIRLILDGLASLQFLFLGKGKFILEIIKAHFSFYKHFYKILKKRTLKNQKLPFYKGSIVFDYFIFKKKYFSDLKNWH